MCVWRLEQKKINQKINKTLKSLQSTEPNPAATSSSFTQKDSRLLWVDEAGSKYSAGEAECTSEEHVCFIGGVNRQYSVYIRKKVKHITDFFFSGWYIGAISLRRVTYDQSV